MKYVLISRKNRRTSLVFDRQVFFLGCLIYVLIIARFQGGRCVCLVKSRATLTAYDDCLINF